MKTRRLIYIIAGSLLIVVNLLVDLVALSEYQPMPDNREYNIGYFIGSHILFIFGLIFLRLAYKLHKKIRRRAAGDEMEDAINSIGEK